MTQSAHKSSQTGKITFGSEILADGRVCFRLWAPTANQVQLRLYDGELGRDFEMNREPGGWYELTSEQAREGTAYHFVIDGSTACPDPASRRQPKDVHGPSLVVGPSSFKWLQSWKGRDWTEAVVYELHVGTFTPEGTFAAATRKLDYLRELGVTAIELMPIAEFPGDRGWGYDGVLLFAPESAYGSPDELRTLIDTAHQKGMMVLLDVVYNHFGPEGNYLHVYAKKFFTEKHKTPWGAAINYDSEQSEIVRAFYVSNLLYWLNEFRFDGIRFDAVHAIQDDSHKHILQELAEAVRLGPGRERKIHLVLENEDNGAAWLTKEGVQSKFYDAQWNDDVHHALHVVATGEQSGYYADYASGSSTKSPIEHLARCLTEGFAYQDEPSELRGGKNRGEVSKDLPPSSFVSFIQNHDQIGNRAFGDRITTLTIKAAVCAIAQVYLLSPNIPMLFMGEEWGATTPFNYFCDLGPELSPLVTEGRRNEFAKFPEFQDPDQRDKIPDPAVEATFNRSKLNWNDLDSPEHQEMLTLYKNLLERRRIYIAPLLARKEPVQAKVLELHDTFMMLQWKFADNESLILLANLSDKATQSLQSNLLKGTKVIWEPSGAPLASYVDGYVPAWSVVWAKSDDKI